MHYVVDRHALEESLEFLVRRRLRVQHSSSDWAASQTEILDKHKENSNSTQAKILARLRG